MRRESMQPREHWQQRVERLGFSFHTQDTGPYWCEDACYAFEAMQVDALETATAELHALCLEAVDRIVRAGRCMELGMDASAADLAERSWWRRDPSLYGRMDLSYDGRQPPKLLEYNADTPTALFEASVVQWYWLQDTRPDADQFNLLHELLIERWRQLLPAGSYVHFAACYDSAEDGATCDYLLDTCVQAGHTVRALDIEDIGWSGTAFVDLENRPIANLFKLYPWEWLLAEPFARHVPGLAMRWIEPAWKMLLSTKAVLPLLWEFFPGHPNLLPASRERTAIAGTAVRKPCWGREGQGVRILAPGNAGPPEEEPCIYQACAPLPRYGDHHALIGSWVIGDRPAGLGVREDTDPVTRNGSRFVPHYFR